MNDTQTKTNKFAFIMIKWKIVSIMYRILDMKVKRLREYIHSVKCAKF